eukprot:4249477-Pyramimonas_sp.AAC.2
MSLSATSQTTVPSVQFIASKVTRLRPRASAAPACSQAPVCPYPNLKFDVFNCQHPIVTCYSGETMATPSPASSVRSRSHARDRREFNARRIVHQRCARFV